jgi:uncharacterized protein (UPF0305 family)
MNNAQILRMLNTRIYRQLPTHRNVSFKTIVRRLINYIDRRRIRRYMVVLINRALDIRDNYVDVEYETDVDPEGHPLDLGGRMRLIFNDFSKKEQRCIKQIVRIIDEGSKDDCFVMLNILRILNLEPEPDEALLIAMNRNADIINERAALA